MSSPPPAPSYPPLQPGTVIAGLTVEASGTVWWQWLTFFIFGNLFAGYWLFLAFLNANPDIRYRLDALLVKLGLKKSHNSKQGRTTSAAAHPEHDQQQQQQGTAGSVRVEPVSPLNATTTAPATLQHLTSTRGGMGGETVSSPLRAHRSRPPTTICMEQTITPRGSLPLSPKASATMGLTPQASATAAAASGNGTPSAAAAGAAAGAQGTVPEVLSEEQDGEESSTYTEGSYEEPMRVRLEWRNLCYAVKSATGLRLIVQVRGQASARGY